MNDPSSTVQYLDSGHTTPKTAARNARQQAQERAAATRLVNDRLPEDDAAMTLTIEPYGPGTCIARREGQWVRFDLNSVQRDEHCLRNGVVRRSGNVFDESDLGAIKAHLLAAVRRRADR